MSEFQFTRSVGRPKKNKAKTYHLRIDADSLRSFFSAQPFDVRPNLDPSFKVGDRVIYNREQQFEITSVVERLQKSGVVILGLKSKGRWSCPKRAKELDKLYKKHGW